MNLPLLSKVQKADSMSYRTRKIMAVEDFRLEAIGEDKTSTKHADESGIVASSELINEFASYTTLHGFHFILQSCSLLRRLMWGVLLVIGLAMLILQCLLGFSKLADHDSVTVKELQRGEKIIFPALTICNLNMLQRDKILGTKAQTFMDDMESVVFGERWTGNGNETFTLNLERVVKEAGHNISEMLSLCAWSGRPCGPKDFFMFVSIQVRIYILLFLQELYFITILRMKFAKFEKNIIRINPRLRF